MEARNKAVADAFARVAICALYCDRWITDYDFVRIIACEHDLASDDTITFDVNLLNKALKVDSRFKRAEDPDGCEAGTVFRKDYSPRVPDSTKRRKVFCYYIVKTRPPSKPSPKMKWSDDIKSMSANLRKKCAIAKEAKNESSTRHHLWSPGDSLAMQLRTWIHSKKRATNIITSYSRIGKTFLVWIRLLVPRKSILLLDFRTQSQSDQEKELEMMNSELFEARLG
jgi:hypothetical protein